MQWSECSGANAVERMLRRSEFVFVLAVMKANTVFCFCSSSSCCDWSEWMGANGGERMLWSEIKWSECCGAKLSGGNAGRN